MKFLAAVLAVAGLAIGVLPVEANSAALATTLLLNSEALDAVKRTGTLVLVDTPVCSSQTLFGQLEEDKEHGRLLHVCLTKHNGDLDELEDTIKHESIHVAQFCKKGTLFPAHLISKDASYLDRLAVSKYPTEQKAMELEARVLATKLDDHQVAQVVSKFCNS